MRVHPTVDLPEYQTSQSSGMDLHAAIDTPMVLKPMQRQIVPCGFKLELPAGYEAQIRARSGLSIKHGITMVNGVGTIDADYRGEVGALVINLGSENYEIEPNARIAQMVIAKYEKISWNETEALSDSSRGSGAFGSTGK